MNKNPLNNLRTKIDEIDQKLLKLFEERIRIVSEVKSFKESKGERLFIRPDREFDMIANLINSSKKTLSHDFVFDIWRKIISHANCLEQDLKIDLFNPQLVSCYKYIIANFYNRKFPINDIGNNFITSLQKLQNDEIHIIIANLFEKKFSKSCWWVDLFFNKTTEIRIFTAVSPKITEENIQLFSIGKITALPSKADKTIFVVKSDKKFSRFDSSNINLLNSTTFQEDRFYLFEINGFYSNNKDLYNIFDESVELRIIGHYPSEIL